MKYFKWSHSFAKRAVTFFVLMQVKNKTEKRKISSDL